MMKKFLMSAVFVVTLCFAGTAKADLIQDANTATNDVSTFSNTHSTNLGNINNAKSYMTGLPTIAPSSWSQSDQNTYNTAFTDYNIDMNALGTGMGTGWIAACNNTLSAMMGTYEEGLTSYQEWLATGLLYYGVMASADFQTVISDYNDATGINDELTMETYYGNDALSSSQTCQCLWKLYGN